MTVKRTVYTSPVEALAALIRSLVAYEQRYQMSSADFYARYQRGEIGDSIDFVEWAGDYPHYQEIKEELERKLAAAGWELSRNILLMSISLSKISLRSTLSGMKNRFSL
jgi:hypothetical protein